MPVSTHIRLNLQTETSKTKTDTKNTVSLKHRSLAISQSAPVVIGTRGLVLVLVGPVLHHIFVLALPPRPALDVAAGSSPSSAAPGNTPLGAGRPVLLAPLPRRCRIRHKRNEAGTAARCCWVFFVCSSLPRPDGAIKATSYPQQQPLQTTEESNAT